MGTGGAAMTRYYCDICNVFLEEAGPGECKHCGYMAMVVED